MSSRPGCGAIADAVDEACAGDSGVDAGALRGLASRLRASDDARTAGETIAELLDRCRDRGLVALRGEIRTQLRALCDAEVALLADGIEAGRA